MGSGGIGYAFRIGRGGMEGRTGFVLKMVRMMSKYKKIKIRKEVEHGSHG